MSLTLINKLLLLNRITKQLIMILVDSVLVVFGLLSAFSIRLGYWFWPQEEMHYIIESWIIFLAPVMAVPVFISFGLYRSIIRTNLSNKSSSNSRQKVANFKVILLHIY